MPQLQVVWSFLYCHGNHHTYLCSEQKENEGYSCSCSVLPSTRHALCGPEHQCLLIIKAKHCANIWLAPCENLVQQRRTKARWVTRTKKGLWPEQTGWEGEPAAERTANARGRRLLPPPLHTHTQHPSSSPLGNGCCQKGQRSGEKKRECSRISCRRERETDGGGGRGVGSVNGLFVIKELVYFQARKPNCRRRETHR